MTDGTISIELPRDTTKLTIDHDIQAGARAILMNPKFVKSRCYI